MSDQPNTKQISIYEGLQMIDRMLAIKEWNREDTTLQIQIIQGIKQRLQQADKMEQELKELKDGSKNEDS